MRLWRAPPCAKGLASGGLQRSPNEFNGLASKLARNESSVVSAAGLAGNPRASPQTPHRQGTLFRPTACPPRQAFLKPFPHHLSLGNQVNYPKSLPEG